MKKLPKSAYLGVEIPAIFGESIGVHLNSNIICAKRDVLTMGCAFDRPTLGLSNAVPTSSNKFMVRLRCVPKVQNVRNFWVILTPPPSSCP